MSQPLTISTSTRCFHYGADGERCGAKCIDPAFFCCATHLHEYLHTDVAHLLNDAAESIVACTRLTAEGLPSLACTKLSSWKRLCNALAALSSNGYHDAAELLTVLVSSIESVGGPWQKKGKPFERLVTRLYLEELAPFVRASSADAPTDSVRVLWNQKLPSLAGGKRQIDVLLRWQHGSDTSDTIVECRDHEIEISEMDAFATLIRRVQADRGVMVTSVGFQDGAKRSADLEGIETRVVTESDFGAETVLRTIDGLYAFEAIGNRLDSATDGTPVSRERILERRIDVMRNGLVIGTLAQLLDEAMESKAPELGSLPPLIKFPTPGVRLLFPDGRAFDIGSVRVLLKVVEQRRTCALILPRRPVTFSIRSPNSDAREVPSSVVPLFPMPTLQAQRFYVNLMGQAYFCEKVDSSSDSAHLILLNDRQHDGARLDIELVAGLDQAPHYYPVEDASAIDALRADLDTFQSFRIPKT
jgi:hypothetical protein